MQYYLKRSYKLRLYRIYSMVLQRKLYEQALNRICSIGLKKG